MSTADTRSNLRKYNAVSYLRNKGIREFQKVRIAESLVEKIAIGDKEIDITFSYLPTSEEVGKNQQRLGPG